MRCVLPRGCGAMVKLARGVIGRGFAPHVRTMRTFATVDPAPVEAHPAGESPRGPHWRVVARIGNRLRIHGEGV